MKPAGRSRLSVPAAIALAATAAGVLLVLQGLYGETPQERLPPPRVIDPLPVLREPGRDITVALEPGADAGLPTWGLLAGQVLGADGRPFAGAELEAVPASYAAMPVFRPRVPDPVAAASGADGRFSLRVGLDWTWTVTARSGTLVAHEVGVLAPREDLLLRLGEGGRLSGRVREVDGRPVASAQLQLSPAGAGDVVREGGASRDGTFSFERVPQGRWRVVALETAPGNAPGAPQLPRVTRQAQVEVELGARDSAPLELVLPPLGALRGKVTAPAGTSLADLVVYAVEGRGAQELSRLGPQAAAKLLGPHLASGKVGADGRFEIGAVAGELSLYLLHPTLLHDPVTGRAGGPEVELVLRAPRLLHGRVVDRAGAPLRQFEVNGVAYGSADGAFAQRLGLRGSTGRPMPLVVRAPGHAPLQTAVDVQGPGDVDAGTLTLGPARVALVAKVVDDATGDPIADLSFLRWTGGTALGEPAKEISPGVYRFDALPEGPASLEARSFQGASHRYQVTGAEAEVLWRFSRGALLRGQVTLRDGKPASGVRVFLAGNVRTTTFTDAQGRFTVPGVPAGPATLVVQRGTGHQLQPLQVPASGELEVAVRLGE